MSVILLLLLLLLLWDERGSLTLEWLLVMVMIVLNLNSRWFPSLSPPPVALAHWVTPHSQIPYGCGVLLSVRAEQ